MAWWYLLLAGLLEVGWTIGMKLSHGFTRPLPSILTALAMIGSLGALGLATKSLPLSTAYGVWVGIGVLGTALLGALVLHEPVSAARLGFLVLLAVAVIGLKLTSP